MNLQENDVRERYWQQTLEVAAALRGRPAAEPGATPRVGELYLCRKTGDFPVEWLVIETEGDRLHLVPVDDYPLTGSRDVELAPSSVDGVAVARCGHGDWFETGLFEPELRTGVASTADLERAQAKRRAVDTGEVEPSLLETVADGDPEYQRWCEGTLEPAVEALTATEAAPPSVWIAGLRRHWKPALALAALLLVAVGLGSYVLHLAEQLTTAQERLAALENQTTEQAAELEREADRRRTSEEEAARLSGLLSEAESALSSAKGELETLSQSVATAEQKLRRALERGIIANVEKLVFGAAQRSTRGTTRGATLVFEAGSSPLIFFELEVVDPEPYLTYRVRLEPEGGDPVTIEKLDREGAWLRFGLPADRLAVGNYQILIDGTGFGETRELEERYRLTVEP